MKQPANYKTTLTPNAANKKKIYSSKSLIEQEVVNAYGGDTLCVVLSESFLFLTLTF